MDGKPSIRFMPARRTINVRQNTNLILIKKVMEDIKKGDIVLLQDGTTQRTAVVVQDGLDSKGRVRVRPERFPMDISIPTEPNGELYVLRKL